MDLREYLMKNRTIFPQVQVQVPMPPAKPEKPVDMPRDPVSAPSPALPATPGGLQISAHSATVLDTEMLGKFIDWLGSVKHLGVSLHQLTPYMEAYEASGYLQPLMVRLILRSMADLDQLITIPPEREFSTEDYAKCMGQLHQIICSSQNGNGTYPPPLDPRSLEQSSGNRDLHVSI